MVVVEIIVLRDRAHMSGLTGVVEIGPGVVEILFGNECHDVETIVFYNTKCMFKWWSKSVRGWSKSFSAWQAPHLRPTLAVRNHGPAAGKALAAQVVQSRFFNDCYIIS